LTVTPVVLLSKAAARRKLLGLDPERELGKRDALLAVELRHQENVEAKKSRALVRWFLCDCRREAAKAGLTIRQWVDRETGALQ
jgi:hypothetical protein